MENKITVIADNGGGLTLQVVDSETRYQHYYDGSSASIDALVTDVTNALNGDDIAFWDGDESDEGWLDPTMEEERNGGYDVMEIDCGHTIVEWGVDHSSHNVRDFSDKYADRHGY